LLKDSTRAFDVGTNTQLTYYMSDALPIAPSCSFELPENEIVPVKEKINTNTICKAAFPFLDSPI